MNNNIYKIIFKKYNKYEDYEAGIYIFECKKCRYRKEIPMYHFNDDNINNVELNCVICDRKIEKGKL